jgi:tyrosyl-tRNA synthetase
VDSYFELLTDLALDELPTNPRDRQQLLAWTIVSHYHGKKAADEAKQGGAIPEFSLAAVTFPAKLFYILNASGLCESSGEARRQIQNGGVKLEGDRISTVDLTFDSPDALNGKVLQVGKKKFVRLVP